MSYLVDTNVVCELLRSKPNHKVVKWFDSVSDNLIYISVLTIGEIRKGVEKLEHGKKKHKLTVWLEGELPRWFENRILPINSEVADRWGCLQAQMKRPIPAIDSLIASTALQHNLCLVTRNERDFCYPSIKIINPFL